MRTHTTHRSECAYACKFLSCIDTLPLKESTEILLRTHTFTWFHTVSITSQPRNPSLAHMHTYTLRHIWICLSLGFPQSTALGVDEIRLSPTQLWSCLTRLFVFTSQSFFLTCFAARFSFSLSLPLSSLSLNPGLANNKERLWLKLAIHQIIFLSFSLLSEWKVLLYSCFFPPSLPVSLFFCIYIHCKLPSKSFGSY